MAVLTKTTTSSPSVSAGWGIKEFFFDRAKVERMVDQKTRKALGRIGALVRQVARRSIRKRKAASAAGSPPSSHTGKLRDNIFFAYDPSTTSVVIGPTPFNGRSYVAVPGGGSLIAGAVPSVLERGGKVGVRELWNVVKEAWTRIPWTYKVKDRYVPVWLATAAEKASSIGVKTIYRGKRALNFYKVPAAKVKQRVRWAKIAPRPYMAPSLLNSKDKYPLAFASGGSVRGAT